MNRAVLQVHLMHPAAVVPRRVFRGDAGLDLAACESRDIGVGERAMIPIGIRLRLPTGYYARIIGRSSSLLRGLSVFEAVIDAGYHGPIYVCVTAIDHHASIAVGDRIAQMILAPIVDVSVELLGDLPLVSDDGRNSSGFGSTGWGSPPQRAETVGALE